MNIKTAACISVGIIAVLTIISIIFDTSTLNLANVGITIWLTVLGFLIAKQADDNSKKTLESMIDNLEMFIGATVRLGDKEGKIIKKPGGSASIEWTKTLSNAIGIAETLETKVTKKENA